MVSENGGVDEEAMAERDAEMGGLGFLVDGKRVDPARVSVIWRTGNKGETWTPRLSDVPLDEEDNASTKRWGA